MAKAQKTVYICQQCGYQSPKWLGKCPDCGEWNSLVEELKRPAVQRQSRRLNVPSPRRYAEIESQTDVRQSSGIPEFDRVLGGGIVPGSVVLVAGDPGIGKSTLLLQIADQLSRQNGIVLYVSGEESERQIKLRGERLGVQADHLYVLAETCLETIFDIINRLTPSAVVVDSIQTIFSEKIESAPGSVSQVREAAAQFLLLAKSEGIPIFLIGHVTKEGMIAGPKALEHIVDTVVYFEGERHHHHRLIRAVKNRYGATNEVGVFEMTHQGLIPVANPSALFLSERPRGVSGSVVSACLEGTRPLLVEVQALVGSSSYGTGRRMAQGVDHYRVALLLAVLERRVGFQLVGSDVFVNIAGGLSVDEPAVDLAVVVAVASSVRNIAVDPEMTIFGEVGLAGEVRAVSAAAVRLRESAQMGFRRVVLPENNLRGLEVPSGMEAIGVRSVVEALEAALER
ncbi:MAG TPA: DNA repair protein RadA [Blastocatellia bacterium]|nr:DNA repair protein RadA [Blastocatellia bacterium]